MAQYIRIGSIVPQKDLYKVNDKELSEPEFWKRSDIIEGDLVRFKRFVVRIEVIEKRGSQCEITGKLRVEVKVRADACRIIHESGPMPPLTLVVALQMRLSNFNWPEKFQGCRSPIWPIDEDPEAKELLCAVPDAMWFAGVLHVLRDHGPFEPNFSGTPAAW